MEDSEFLDWLCWKWATEGERFYPPDETTEECIATMEENEIEVDDETIASERAKHYRALGTVIERYNDMERMGFEPRERAERYIEQQNERDSSLPWIDWSWYDDCGRLGES